MPELVGSQLPSANFLIMGENGPEAVSSASISDGKKVIIFAVPGAYTPTCTKTHLPGFVENADALRAKGVDGIYCVAVNDPFVTDAWAKDVDAASANVTVLADSDSSFTKALGMDFDAPPAGLLARSQRYAMIVDNGVITEFDVEENPGVCTVSSAEHLLGLL